MIRWGILGAGNIAHRFAKSLRYEEDAVLYAISGRSQEKLDAFQKEFPCEKTYVGHENMLADPNIDAVYIALPHGLHKEWALKALEKGIAVLCEKPAALNEAEMKEISACAKEHNTLFMEAMKPRFLPAYAELKKRLAEGVIGTLENVYTKICFTIPKEAAGKSYHTSGKDGGALLDSGIYCASLIDDLLDGEPRFIQTYSNYFGGVDWYVDSRMRFDNGTAEMEVAFDRTAPRNAELTGTEGSVTIIDLHRPQTFIIHKNGTDEEVTVPYENDDFYSEIHHFDELLRAGKTESDIHPYAAMEREAHILDRIRRQFTIYNTSDLEVLETQEKLLSMDTFTSEEALVFGKAIIQEAKKYDGPVAIRIDRCSDDLTVFQYVMEGKKASNLKYMDGKKQSVLDSGHSSAWVYAKYMMDHSYADWVNDGVHLISGGAFPLYVKGKIAAVVQVSGLHEGKDHELIVRALAGVSGTKVPPFIKGIG